MYVNIAVKVPLAQSIYTYSNKENLPLERGSMVIVPFGKRQVQGIVTEIDVKEAPDFQIKDVAELVSDEVKLSEFEFELYDWMSRYYHYSFGQLLIENLPKFLKRPRAVNIERGEGKSFVHKPNKVQADIIQRISNSLEGGFSKHLVHGVTGSGKTLIYLSLIKKTIDSGKSAQFLLPEINLTPQFIDTFKTFLDCKIFSYHSSVSNSEKFTIYKELQEHTEPVLIIGVRSSIFLPIKELGLIVIDEEHDNSFKQSDRCPYNGRDIAIKKAHMSNCPIVLGSATPSVENFNNFYGTANYYSLKERVSTGNFPEIITLQNDGAFDPEGHWPIQDASIEMMKEHLDAGEQVLVFINKLGFASYLQCRSCGNQFQNDDCGCGLNLRYFKAKNILSCSHCEYKTRAPDSCPTCGNVQLLQKGFGTERVEEVLKKAFMNKVIERFDRDEIKTFKELNDKLERFHSGKIDILVGTQMLAKGHNFEKVNCVLILGIDSQLNFSDFRANEKTFQLVTQVAGRAGRYSPKSKVVIQTANPDNMVFKYLKNGSFDEFYLDELKFREMSKTPPYSKLIMIYMSSTNRSKLVNHINSAAMFLNQVNSEKNLDVQVLGPTSSFIEKRAKQFTWMIMLKSDDLNSLHSLVRFFHFDFKIENGVNLKIDVDPNHMQ